MRVSCRGHIRSMPMNLIRHTAFLCVAALLSACTSAPVPRPVALAPVKFAAVLEPGCLLPGPDALASAKKRSASFDVKVDSTGRVTSATVQASTGRDDVDAALGESVLRCRFTPAYTVDIVSRTKAIVPDAQTMSLSWPSSESFIGPHRCLRPDYPHSARRAEETGSVFVAFRVTENHQLEAQVQERSAKLRTLRPLSIQAVTQCLAHEEVLSSLPVDTWFVVAYDWHLE
jgi:hypothetical protein